MLPKFTTPQLQSQRMSVMMQYHYNINQMRDFSAATLASPYLLFANKISLSGGFRRINHLILFLIGHYPEWQQLLTRAGIT
jgi:hypothetical protein